MKSMMYKPVFVILGVALTAASAVSAAEISSALDEDNNELLTVLSAPPVGEILTGYGAALEANDPILQVILAQIVDLASPDLRNEEEVIAEDTGTSSILDSEGNVIGETVWISATVGSIPAVIYLSSNGVMVDVSVIATIEGEAVESNISLQVYYSPTSESLWMALPGTCRCSKKGVTGCTKSMCENGDTCPGNNGDSCGYYTNRVIRATPLDDPPAP